MPPAAATHLVPSAEVRTTGPGTPTASQPTDPCVTLVSARKPRPAPSVAGEDTSVQRLPPRLRQTAG